ncbi:MAG: glycoside hydrolase family 3 C-terminal domain-containing protein, partial [Gammaproteobacteria bacterium]|nr:glycoside hydrolase family 3 C-terminal domain-containing protein [Gammaproteobacteria bacterium]
GLEARDYEVDAGLREVYDSFIVAEKAKLPKRERFWELLPPIPEMALTEAQLDEAVQNNDIAFITIGRNSGEFQDRELDGDFYLTDAELELINGVSKVFRAAGKKVVVILNIGNVIETASWRDKADAIVLLWQGGQEAGHAAVDVLTGEVNPSGKLPTTFPVVYQDVPSSDSFPGTVIEGEPFSFGGGILTAYPARVEYEEGIYVGYRYYDTFDVTPAPLSGKASPLMLPETRRRAAAGR